jgi:hypothetical protein
MCQKMLEMEKIMLAEQIGLSLSRQDRILLARGVDVWFAFS